jgi:hypothetical protein
MKRRLFAGGLAALVTDVVVRSQVLTPRLLGIVGTDDAFFDDTAVHEIRLNMNESDWQALRDHYLEDIYFSCDFRWRDWVVRNVGIRSRGHGSRNPVKPGVRIDFDHYVSGQMFLGLTYFILRNQTQDASNLHERLSMLLFRRLGIPASREAHTKLYVNDRYWGLYSIVERVDPHFLTRNLGEGTGYVYKYDYPVNGTPYYFEDRGSTPEAYVPLPFQPRTHQTDPRADVIIQLVQAISQTPEATWRTAMSEFLDLRKLVKHVAVEQFLSEQDGFLSDYGGMNNYYFYRYDNRKLFTFIPWDKSEAFKDGPFRSIFKNIAGVPSFKQNRLMARALAYRDLYDAYLDALLEAAASASEVQPDGRPWLQREIEFEYNQIRDAALADPNKPFSNALFEQAVDDLRAFARQRRDSVVQQVNAAR